MDLRRIANNTILKSNGKWDLKHKDGDTDDIISTVLYADKLADQYTAEMGRSIRLKSIADFRELWQFVRRNIRYVEDGDVQVIQSPAELWRTKVGDCKSFSVFIKSICSNAGFKGGYRFVRYGSNEFVTHVYPWVWFRGRRIFLDAVKGAEFNQDDLYAGKIDYEWNTGAKIGAPDPASTIPSLFTFKNLVIGGVTYFVIKKVLA